MTKLILHYAPDNASLIIRLALDHLNLPFETVLVDRASAAQRDPAYLTINPNGLIPTLITPDGAIFETTAILLWLEGRFGGLMPTGDTTRTSALKWLIWIGNTLHPSQRMMFYPDTYTDGDIEDLRAPTRRRIARLLTLLSDAKDADWLEAAPSAPSFYLAPLLRWCAIYGGDHWFDLADYPRLFAFAQRMEQTEPAFRAMRTEGLGAHPFTAPKPPNPPEGSAV
ncbi:glutathione S-transferase family protein [Octadecabacter sp. 1_MG-2023]|uniref:glutathione S-transferase family protein n=1 Tax=unclassified Octadecabacter TaxID=196158 RepID=UPI001C095292|nr:MULTISPECIES: glutathione S-transferase family protein [unclassified Octadecabacter]MBU2992868.1 glutathione S-transferase family protein [Octadecabacter sp. B2R22]MDO6733681.1 glutathione S-transferase family protein [Octadecabacter sp. 1_MG-2023]